MSSRKTDRRRAPLLSGFRLRLTGLYILLFGTTVLGFAVFLTVAYLRNHQREFDAALHNYVLDVAHAIDPTEIVAGRLSPQIFAEEAEKIFPFAIGETLLQVESSDGRPLAKSQSLGMRELAPATALLARLRTESTVFSDVPLGPDGGLYRRVAHLLPARDGRELIVQVAVPMILLERQKEGLLAVLAISIPIVLILAAGGGLWMSRRAMEPFAAIIATAREIQASRLSERVPVPRSRDEIRELAETLNGLLDRLESAFSAQEDFIADASHQLKTPLSIILMEIEMLRPRLEEPEAVRAFLESTAQEVGHLAKMVEELLQLARVEGGLESATGTRLRLDEIVMEAASRLEPLAKKSRAGFLVSLSPPPPGTTETDEDDFQLYGDPQLLRCLVENILENAVKYSPPGTAVAVSLEDSGAAMHLVVRDHGPGIPEGALPKVFDRFFRAETTRDRVGGSGLGLPLVKRIAELHGARAKAENHREGGALLTVDFPKVRPAQPA